MYLHIHATLPYTLAQWCPRSKILCTSIPFRSNAQSEGHQFRVTNQVGHFGKLEGGMHTIEIISGGCSSKKGVIANQGGFSKSEGALGKLNLLKVLLFCSSLDLTFYHGLGSLSITTFSQKRSLKSIDQ